MRNTSSHHRDTWATLVGQYREAAGMSKVELARRLGIDRATVSRWEQGLNRPEQAAVVQRFADLFAIDIDIALAAAGLRPATLGDPTPPEPLDPDIELLMRKLNDPNTDDETKAFIRRNIQLWNSLPPTQPPRRGRKAG